MTLSGTLDELDLAYAGRVLVIAKDDSGHNHLMDREALAQWLTVAEITIRRHCRPTHRDPGTGKLFYHAEACADLLADRVRPRAKVCADGVRRARRT